MNKYERAKQYNDRFINARKRLNNRINDQAQTWTPSNASSSHSYDPTMSLAQEMIRVAHSNNRVKAQLVANIDRDSKHYGDKTLLSYTDKHHHLLVMELPLNDAQYQAIRHHAKQW